MDMSSRFAHFYCFMQSCQSKDMDEKIKSYRQAIFKLDHAERKRAEAPASKGQRKPSPHLCASHISKFACLCLSTAHRVTAEHAITCMNLRPLLCTSHFSMYIRTPEWLTRQPILSIYSIAVGLCLLLSILQQT